MVSSSRSAPALLRTTIPRNELTAGPEFVPSFDGELIRLEQTKLMFQLLDSVLKWLDDGSDLLLREPLVNVLRAVHVPRLDFEQDFPGARSIREFKGFLKK